VDISSKTKPDITKGSGVYSKDLIEILFRLPYTKRKFLIEAKLGNPKTAGNYLMSLENNGFLKSIRVGKEKLYLNHKLMEILKKPIRESRLFFLSLYYGFRN